MMSKSTRRVLLIGVGFAVLAGCTPSYQVPRGLRLRRLRPLC